MNKKYIPYIVGIPNMGVGLLWTMNMVLIPLLVTTITTNNMKLGILISMGAFTGMFVQYLAGIISDRSNFKMGRRKPFIILGSVLSAVFMCIMPFAHSYAALFIVAFLFYFSLNFFQGPYYSLIPESVDENKLGLANGFSKIISVLGSAVIFALGPALWDMNRAYPFFLAAALGLSSVLLTVFFIKEDPSKYKKPEQLSFDFIKMKPIMKLYSAVFFVFLSYGCITPFFVKYCMSTLKMTKETANSGLLMLTLVGAAFAFPLGMLADRIEKRKVLLIGVLIFATSLFAGVFVKSSLGLYLILSIIGIGFIAIQITIYSILAEIAPPERLGELMGIMNTFISLSQFLANITMGGILEKYGYSLFFPIASIIMFIAALVVLFAKFSNQRTITENSRKVAMNK